jgi:predicted porin
MKKTVLALCAMTLASGAAMAQSSVTVFGVIDLAARNLKGADSVKFLSNEGRAASRLGFRGVEDMGGGMKASFHLEHAVLPDDGSVSGDFWQRRATVSLTSGFGEVRIGRHKLSTRTILDDFDPFGTSGMAEITRLYSGLRLSSGPLQLSVAGAGFINRSSNQVAYFLPSNLGGVYGSFDVSAGEGASDSTTTAVSNKGYSGRLGYRTKELNVSAAYGEHGVNSKLKTMTVGASYDFGAFAVQGMYSKNERGSLDQKVLNIGGSAKLGEGRLIASYAKADGNGRSVVGGLTRAVHDASLIALGYDYSLSKRTSVYGTYARISNDGNGTFSLGGTRAGGAEGPIAGGNSTGYEVGIRHSF